MTDQIAIKIPFTDIQRAISAVSIILLFLNICGVIVLTEFARSVLFLLWFCPEVWLGTLWMGRKFSAWNLQRKARKAEAEVSRQILEEERQSL